MTRYNFMYFVFILIYTIFSAWSKATYLLLVVVLIDE